MVRKLTVVIGLAMSVLVARDASAIPITLTPVDLDSWTPGPRMRLFDAQTMTDPPYPPAGGELIGVIRSNVFFDGTQYTYTYLVQPFDPGVTMVSLFHTLFDVGGFTGVAGWRFSDTLTVGGTGTAADFFLTEDHGQLSWQTNGLFFPTTTFFFVSTIYPWPLGSRERFGLVSDTVNGIGLGLAPVPEPGSIALFGSGLMGLYAAMRRRRSPKA
jgi:PEP-CTERM motif